MPSGHGYRGDTGVDTNVDAERLEACATAMVIPRAAETYDRFAAGSGPMINSKRENRLL